MRKEILIAGFLACLITYADAGYEYQAGSSMTAVRGMETTTTQTETIVEETIEEIYYSDKWQGYFIEGFANWHSLEQKSEDLKVKVTECFSHTINGKTYWEIISSQQQYLEFIAAATGYKGDFHDVAKVKQHCTEVAATKPRLLALAFKSISKNVKNHNEKLTVSKLALERYDILQKEIVVPNDWKQCVITNFMNFKSTEGNSQELVNKVITVLEYDQDYFDKFIKKKIYAEYLAYATGYKGEIHPKKSEELKKHLKDLARSKPRLVALALKYLSKNLKDSKQELQISKIATERYGIQQKTNVKAEWQTHFIKEYLGYDSKKKYKERDQVLRVTSMLKYQAEGATILDVILKKKEYREFFARSIGYEYDESSYDEQDFRKHIDQMAQLHPTLVSLSFRSICKNLQSNEQLVISQSAKDYIRDKLPKKTETEKKTTKKITKTLSTTTTTKTWEEYVIREFATFRSMSEDSSEVRNKVEQFLNYNTEGHSCLDSILQNETYSQYIAYSTGFQGDHRNAQALVEHLKKIGQTKPRLLAGGLKHITQNIENHSEQLVVSRVATEKYHIEEKVFQVQTSSG